MGSTNHRYDFGNTQNSFTYNFSTEIRHKIYVDKNQSYINGVLQATANNTTFTAGGELWIGASYTNPYTGLGNHANMKLYSFKIYEGNAIVRDFIPVQMKDTEEIGLYDKVEGKFYGNSGSGTFIAGNKN